MKNLKACKIHSHVPGVRVRSVPAKMVNARNYQELNLIGIGGLNDPKLNQMVESFGMDAIQPTVTTASMPIPIQFLQQWLPGLVHVITAARKIDEILGIDTVGDWAQAEIIQTVLELTGTAVPYSDYTDTPLSSWNPDFERRSIERFEEGMQVGVLEEERASYANFDSGVQKREAAAVALEIQRNLIGFYGYNNGANRLYGFFNDPGLPAYVTVATGTGGGTMWSTKTTLEIIADLRTMFRALRVQSKDTIDPFTTPITLVLPTSAIDYMNVTTDLGYSVQEWLEKNYKKVRIVSAPELDGANGGANVMYAFADRINDQSTDGGRVFVQNVPAKFRLLGVEKKIKRYEEAYSNATAGVMVKRPFAVVRYTGI